MISIVPIIDKIIREDDAFICYDKNEELVCVTSSKEIADMYFAIPMVLTRQAEIIEDLKARLEYVTEEYNNLVMGMIPSGSNLIH